MENMELNKARENALMEMYKAIEGAADRIDGTAELAATAPSILTMCEACVRLESAGKPDAMDKVYERIFAMNKPNAAPKTEGETGNDGRNLGAYDVGIGT